MSSSPALPAGYVFSLEGSTFLILSMPLGGLDLSRLTPAQRGVVLALAQGLSNAEIARARGGSPRTVANHLAAAYRRLGVGSRAELVARLSLRGGPAAETDCTGRGARPRVTK